jgi:hypothetical protein
MSKCLNINNKLIDSMLFVWTKLYFSLVEEGVEEAQLQYRL